jgi:integrase
VDLPKGVHKVISRGREYFYYQAGRGSDNPGPRVRIPDDPRTPEFWQAIRQAQGVSGYTHVDTVNALIDSYETWEGFALLSEGTQYRYRRMLKIARTAWGNLPADGLRPGHVQAVMDGFAALPGKANEFLGTMRALSAWARARDKIPASLIEGVKRYKIQSGHKPWTDAQIDAIGKLTGMVRRGIMLMLYTGQRGSDIVRLGWTHIDDGGFALGQKKTGVQVWCPIVPELHAEMLTWEKSPGPFLRQHTGKQYDRKLFWLHFTQQAEKIPELKGVTLHGLRATAVVRLRQAGLSTAQISDIIGMSLQMIERYCRFADKKANGKAALISLAERSKNKTVKRLGNGKH